MNTVVFSAYGDKRLLSDAIAAGARGYVMKGSPPEDLLRGVRTVTTGKPFVDPSLSPALLMSAVGHRCAALASASARSCSCSPRASTPRRSRMDRAQSETVKSDTKRAILKLEADTRVHAVAIALRQAIIE